MKRWPFDTTLLLLLSLLAGSGRAAPPASRTAPPCTATACAALPANRMAPAGLWGVKGDGASDDAPALNAAFAYCGGHPGVTVLLSGTARAAATVAIPGGCEVAAAGSTASDPPALHIVCDLGVTPCVAAGEADRKAISLRRVHIGRAPGEIPPGSIGLKVMGANAVLEDVVVDRSDVCEQFWTTDGAAAAFGYTAHIERGFTFACASYHIESVGWPELTIHAARGGYTSTVVPDLDSKAYIHLTGGPKQCPTGAGPNTVSVSDSNVIAFSKADGSQAVYNALWDFSALNEACRQVAIFSFINGHAEEIRHLVTSDASVSAIDSFRFLHSTWVGGIHDQGTNWIQLDPATQVLRWTLFDDDVYFWNAAPNCGLCLAPTAPIEGLFAQDLRFYGRTDTVQAGPVNVTIAAPAGSWGRVTALDMLGGGTVSVTGPGAAGIAVSGTFAR